MINVAVFFGGDSCEREISILTGVFVMNLLDRERYNVQPVYVDADGKFYTSPLMRDLKVFQKNDRSSFRRVVFEDGGMVEFNQKKKRIGKRQKTDVVFNCCHGGWGEGGGVAMLAARLSIPLASPPSAASGVFMDKTLTKLIAKALSVPVVDYMRVKESDYQKRGRFLVKHIGARLHFPVVVKPACLGSSIGITLARTEEEVKIAVESALRLDSTVLIEKYIDQKRDVNCAAYLLDGEIIVSEPEIAHGGGIYAFSDKYLADKRAEENQESEKNEKDKTAPLSQELRDKIRTYTRTLYKRMNLSGVVRMDYLVTATEVYLGEVNTVPGSLAYYLFCERISDAKRFFSDLIENAIKTWNPKTTLLPTGVLTSVSVTGKNRGVRL